MNHFYLLIISFCLILHSVLCENSLEQFAENAKGHTNNWAVLVDTSRFWFNYRHVANVLSIYRSVKRLGIPDSQIVLMIADDMACNPRNPRPATVFNNAKQHINVYGDDVEVDYRGYEEYAVECCKDLLHTLYVTLTQNLGRHPFLTKSFEVLLLPGHIRNKKKTKIGDSQVTVENFIRVLTGRLPPETPRSKQLLTDEGSNILIYLTGHGGDGFLKFQDSEEITSQEMADALEQMWQKQRYNEIFFMIDTCQAASMYEKFYSPNILAVGSSLVGEDSLSHHVDASIGVYIIDRYTYYALEFLEQCGAGSKRTMAEFLKVCPKSQCISTVGIRTDLFRRNLNKVPITDFFGSVRPVQLTILNNQTVPIVTAQEKPKEMQKMKVRYSYVPALSY